MTSTRAASVRIIMIMREVFMRRLLLEHPTDLSVALSHPSAL
jgi:hypothetical protein